MSMEKRMSHRPTLERLILVLVFGCASLQSFYFYQISLAPTVLVAAATVIVTAAVRARGWLIRGVFQRRKSELLALGIVVCALLLSIAWGRIDISTPQGGFSIKLGLGFLLCALTLFCFQQASFERKNIEYALRVVVLGMLAFWLIQDLAHEFFDFTVDYLQPLTGERQRILRTDEVTRLLLIRPAGLFNEPGTYGTFQIFLCCALLSFRRTGINAWIAVAAMVSVLFSFACLPYLVGGLLMAVLVQANWRDRKLDGLHPGNPSHALRV